MPWARTPLERAALVLCTVLGACAFFQQPSVLEPTNIDDSWLYAMTHAAANGLRYGDDLVFNYGPLGWVLYPYAHPAWFGWELAANLVVSAAFSAIALATARRLESWPAALFFVAWLALSSAYIRGLSFYLTPALVTLLALRALPRVSGWVPAAVLLCGVGALVKLTLVGLGLPCVAALAWAAWRHGRPRVAVGCAVGYAAVVAVGWVALGQSANGFVRFHRLGLELAIGHAAGMAQAAADSSWAPVALVAVTSALAVVAARSGVTRASGPPLLVAALSTVFLEWKQAYVRADTHRLELFALLPLLAFALPAPPSRLRRALRGAAVGLLVYGMATILPQHGSWAHLVGSWPAKMVLAVQWILDEPGLRDDVGRDARARAEAVALPRVRRRVAGAPVDLAPSILGAVFTNDLTWRPRPCFDGRLAYRAALYDANYAHLASSRAPRFLLVRPSFADDGLLPASVGAASLRAALERYRPRFLEGTHVLAERRPQPIDLGAGEGGRRVTVRLGEDVPVGGSPDDLVWMSLEVSRSLLGRARGLLVRPRPLYLVVRAGDVEHRFGIVPGMVERPVLLSPLVRSEDNVLFLARASPAPSMPVVQSVRVETDDPWDYAGEVALTLTRAAGARGRLVAPWDGEEVPYVSPSRTGPGRCGEDEVVFAGGEPTVLAVNGPARLTLPFGVCARRDGDAGLAELDLTLVQGGARTLLRREVIRPGAPLAPRELHVAIHTPGPVGLSLHARVDESLLGRAYFRPAAPRAPEPPDPDAAPVDGLTPDAVVSSFPVDTVHCGSVVGTSLHAPADAVFVRPPGAYRVTGVLGVCAGNQSGGLGFAVGARGAEGVRAAWARDLGPAEVQGGAEIAFDATVTLGEGDAIVIRAEPAGRADGDWAWVGQLSIAPVAGADR